MSRITTLSPRHYRDINLLHDLRELEAAPGQVPGELLTDLSPLRGPGGRYMRSCVLGMRKIL